MNNCNIVKTIEKETVKYRNKTAVKDGLKNISYSELFSDIEKISSELTALGISPNCIIGVQYTDSYEYIVICLSILSLGAVIAPAPMSLSDIERDELITKLNINFFICHSSTEFYGTNHSSSEKINLEQNSILAKMNAVVIKFFPLKSDFHTEIYSSNPAFIRFSSGTTGKSKGVLISHKSVIERTSAANSALKITDDDTVIWLLNMSYHFVVTILLFLRKGATIVICCNEFPQGLLNELKNSNSSQCTFIYASPFHYKMLTDYDIFTPDLLSKTRLAISTAMKLPSAIAESFYQKFNLYLSEAYGIIEVGLPFVHSPVNPDKQGSVGKMSPEYQIKILNPDNNGAGQICIKGPGCFSAYINPYKPFTELFPDGWFNTGDIGYLDNDGYLFIVSRKKDLINFAGMKIFPYSVEAVILQHPSVKEVVVYGEKHDTFGEIPCASIILKDGTKEEGQLLEIKKFCYKNLAQFEVPKKIEFVNEIEKTHSGKIKRRN